MLISHLVAWRALSKPKIIISSLFNEPIWWWALFIDASAPIGIKRILFHEEDAFAISTWEELALLSPTNYPPTKLEISILQSTPALNISLLLYGCVVQFKEIRICCTVPGGDGGGKAVSLCATNVSPHHPKTTLTSRLVWRIFFFLRICVSFLATTRSFLFRQLSRLKKRYIHLNIQFSSCFRHDTRYPRTNEDRKLTLFYRKKRKIK